MWSLLPPTALLLIVSSGIRAGLQKAVVILEPQWVRVLEEDSVTLKCQGTNSPEDNSTKWFHNESLISHQDASYFIGTARINDSGEYKCQTALTMPSDPVKLEVHIGWLLLQTTQWPEFREGDPIRLKCHSWRDKPVYKVTYLQNGKGRKYFHRNSEFLIPEATQKDSGSYFCRGIIGRNNKSSETLRITVGDPTSPSIFPPWHQITVCLLIGLLFAIDTVLYFSVQRGLRSSWSAYEEPKLHWSKEPQNKTLAVERKSFRSSKVNSETPESEQPLSGNLWTLIVQHITSAWTVSAHTTKVSVRKHCIKGNMETSQLLAAQDTSEFSVLTCGCHASYLETQYARLAARSCLHFLLQRITKIYCIHI